MTNYQKWDKWNAEEESDKITAREGTDQLEQTAAKDERKLLAQLGKIDIQTKQVADAFRSQAAVDALKAKGGMRNRRKRGGGTNTTAPSALGDTHAVTDNIKDDSGMKCSHQLMQQNQSQDEVNECGILHIYMILLYSKILVFTCLESLSTNTSTSTLLTHIFFLFICFLFLMIYL